MFYRFTFICFALFSGIAAGFSQNTNLAWQVSENQIFTLHYTAPDSSLVPVLTETLLRGVAENSAFFGQPFLRSFDVWCFPDRAALDRQWQHDWGDTTFQSSCWMVASGVAHRLDLLSPRVWDTQACEHGSPLVLTGSGASFRNEKESAAFRRLITHELTHVYHGQHCRIPDFTGMDALGWWVEGLATYVSGQLDSTRLVRVQAFVREGKAPAQLDQFWSGPQRYGLSGSVVAALDARLGRGMLFRLLPLSTSQEIFAEMQLTEEEIYRIWREYLEGTKE